MSGILSIIAGAAILFIVMFIYLAVSYKYSKSNMPKGCTGDCASCRMHVNCDTENN